MDAKVCSKPYGYLYKKGITIFALFTEFLRKYILMLPIRETSTLPVRPTADSTEIVASFSPLGIQATVLPRIWIPPQWTVIPP